MITAADCRAISAASDVQVDKILADAEPHIKKAAEENKKEWVILHDGVHSSFPTYTTPEKTPLHRKLIMKLTGLGFNASYTRVGLPYVPRGLSDDCGEGPLHVNWSILIRW